VSKRWLVWDTETTGLLLPSTAPLEKQPKIIELAIVELAPNERSEFVVAREASWLINPDESLSPEIIKITGLKDEDLEGKPRFVQALREIQDWFLGAWGMVAHNLPFDRGMLVHELRRGGREHAFPYPPAQIDTVAAFEHEWGRRMRMTELYERKLGKPLKQTHRALDDARALAEIVLTTQLLNDA